MIGQVTVSLFLSQIALKHPGMGFPEIDHNEAIQGIVELIVHAETEESAAKLQVLL
jgi:hypothetical protein